MRIVKLSGRGQGRDRVPASAAGSGEQPTVRAPTLRLDLRSCAPSSLPQKGAGQEYPGNASAERAAASRDVLERELDRVQGAVQASESSFGQQLNWLLLAQALFLNAYLVVLVFGSAPAIPGRRWLLAGLALFAAVFAVFTYLALRGSRDAVSSLRATRQDLEATLARQGRAPLFAPRSLMSAGLSSFAVNVLPASFIVGWLVISIYALAVPAGNGAAARLRPAAEQTAAQISAASSTARAPAKAAPRNATKPTRQQSAPVKGTEPAEQKRSGFRW